MAYYVSSKFLQHPVARVRTVPFNQIDGFCPLIGSHDIPLQLEVPRMWENAVVTKWKELICPNYEGNST